MLIVDIGMPKMNGIEVASRTQKLERPPGGHHLEHALGRVLHHAALRARARVSPEGCDRRGPPAAACAVSAGKPASARP